VHSSHAFEVLIEYRFLCTIADDYVRIVFLYSIIYTQVEMYDHEICNKNDLIQSDL
jgi:hypothetical protein